ncbi:MAG: SDR family NAD(P)-dependent oxidoreductase, partial [Bacteroidetes bacterium]
MNLENQVVWITGASSGIGEALAYACIDAGARVILSARRASELERVKAACARPDRVYLFPLDLTDTESLSTVAANVVNTTGRIDILINNGGISQR